MHPSEIDAHIQMIGSGKSLVTILVTSHISFPCAEHDQVLLAMTSEDATTVMHASVFLPYDQMIGSEKTPSSPFLPFECASLVSSDIGSFFGLNVWMTQAQA